MTGIFATSSTSTTRRTIACLRKTSGCRASTCTSSCTACRIAVSSMRLSRTRIRSAAGSTVRSGVPGTLHSRSGPRRPRSRSTGRSNSLAEVGRFEDDITLDDYLADFSAQFHDLREAPRFAGCRDPDSYVRSQALAGGCSTRRPPASSIRASGARGCLYRVLSAGARDERAQSRHVSLPVARRTEADDRATVMAMRACRHCVADPDFPILHGRDALDVIVREQTVPARSQR